jgi:acetyltransferase-like isoleucine patch superfamily enzyme
MERLTIYPSPGPWNSLQYWTCLANPLRVVWNFLIIYANRFNPSENLKNVLYRLTGMKVGRRCSFGLCAMVDIFYPHKITVGENCILGYDSVILAHEFLQRELRVGPVVIGNDVTVGTKAVILPGVVIGDGAVVSSLSLVNKDVPPRTIVGGVPIHVLGTVPEVAGRLNADPQRRGETQRGGGQKASGGRKSSVRERP